MTIVSKIGRLFHIKTRFEAWLVIYAIALGAVERGRHYIETYPGVGGWLLALACTGVVFIAGGKLLDAVKPPPQPSLPAPRYAAMPRRRPAPHHRPMGLVSRGHSESRSSRRGDY